MNEIETWDPEREYQAGDRVNHVGRQFIAEKTSKGKDPAGAQNWEHNWSVIPRGEEVE